MCMCQGVHILLCMQSSASTHEPLVSVSFTNHLGDHGEGEQSLRRGHPKLSENVLDKYGILCCWLSTYLVENFVGGSLTLKATTDCICVSPSKTQSGNSTP